MAGARRAKKLDSMEFSYVGLSQNFGTLFHPIMVAVCISQFKLEDLGIGMDRPKMAGG